MLTMADDESIGDVDAVTWTVYAPGSKLFIGSLKYRLSFEMFSLTKGCTPRNNCQV